MAVLKLDCHFFRASAKEGTDFPCLYNFFASKSNYLRKCNVIFKIIYIFAPKSNVCAKIIGYCTLYY